MKGNIIESGCFEVTVEVCALLIMNHRLLLLEIGTNNSRNTPNKSHMMTA